MATREVILHGAMAALHRGPLRLAVDSAAEAARALRAVLPGFARAARAGHWCVRAGAEDGEPVRREAAELRLPPGQALHVCPVAAGAGTGAVIALSLLTVATSFYALSLVPDSPPPESGGDPDQRASALFDRGVNATEPGAAIPVVYGRFRTGSVVVSVGLSAEQVPP